METMDNLEKDPRIERILELIIKFTRNEFNARETVSEKGDSLDAIIIGLNTLGEELESANILK